MKLKIDKIGRIILPLPIRKELGIEKGSVLDLSLIDNQIVLKGTNELNTKIKEQISFYKDLLNNAVNNNLVEAIQVYTGYIKALEWVLNETSISI